MAAVLGEEGFAPLTLAEVRQNPQVAGAAPFIGEQGLLARGIYWAPSQFESIFISAAHGEAEYTLISRFDSFRSAADWELSPQRAEWLARVEPHVDTLVSFEKQPGLEFWFTPPAAPALRQPPRWKMWLLTLLALYPVSVGSGLLMAPVVGHWPLLLKALPQMLLVVTLMTYVVMPRVTRWAAGWLSR